MHYQLVAKTSDFTPEELQEKLLGFMPVTEEMVHQYGCWQLSRYADFVEFAADEGIDISEAQTINEEDGILRQYGFAYGNDRQIYEKVSIHFNSFEIKTIKRYKDVIVGSRGVYAFISADGNFYYVTDVRCPFAADDVVYVMDCHN